MSFMDKLQAVMTKYVSPLVDKMGKSKTLSALSAGMMNTMPVSLGVSVICILVNLPIPGVSEWIESSGLSLMGNQIMLVTLSALAIYLVMNVGYHYAINEGKDGMICGSICVGVFFVLIPIFLQGEGYFFTAIETRFIGSDGIFVGMVTAILVSKAFCWLMDKKLAIKLPASVPPNVSNSLSPIFVSMIIFTIAFVIKYLMYLTPYGDIFTFFNTVVSAPIMLFGATPWAVVGVELFATLMWFFGVHPSPIKSAYGVVTLACAAANIEAIANGEPLPYFAVAVVSMCVFFSGTGNTIGLAFCLQKAKSARLKAIKTIGMVPNLFNINEPLIFGVPVMLNPIFLVPMLLAVLIPGILGIVVTSMTTFPMNVSITLPWVTPTIITAFVQGGIPMFLLILAAVILTTLSWYPFFKVADAAYLKEEQEQEAAQEEDDDSWMFDVD